MATTLGNIQNVVSAPVGCEITELQSANSCYLLQGDTIDYTLIKYTDK